MFQRRRYARKFVSAWPVFSSRAFRARLEGCLKACWHGPLLLTTLHPPSTRWRVCAGSRAAWLLTLMELCDRLGGLLKARCCEPGLLIPLHSARPRWQVRTVSSSAWLETSARTILPKLNTWTHLLCCTHIRISHASVYGSYAHLAALFVCALFSASRVLCLPTQKGSNMTHATIRTLCPIAVTGFREFGEIA